MPSCTDCSMHPHDENRLLHVSTWRKPIASIRPTPEILNLEFFIRFQRVHRKVHTATWIRCDKFKRNLKVSSERIKTICLQVFQPLEFIFLEITKRFNIYTSLSLVIYNAIYPPQQLRRTWVQHLKISRPLMGTVECVADFRIMLPDYTQRESDEGIPEANFSYVVRCEHSHVFMQRFLHASISESIQIITIPSLCMKDQSRV